jgi:hypothetical protein
MLEKQGRQEKSGDASRGRCLKGWSGKKGEQGESGRKMEEGSDGVEIPGKMLKWEQC